MVWGPGFKMTWPYLPLKLLKHWKCSWPLCEINTAETCRPPESGCCSSPWIQSNLIICSTVGSPSYNKTHQCFPNSVKYKSYQTKYKNCLDWWTNEGLFGNTKMCFLRTWGCSTFASVLALYRYMVTDGLHHWTNANLVQVGGALGEDGSILLLRMAYGNTAQSNLHM